MIRIRQCVIFGRWGVCCMSCARWSLHSRRRVIYNYRPRLSVGVIEEVPDFYSLQLRTLIRLCITVDQKSGLHVLI